MVSVDFKGCTFKSFNKPENNILIKQTPHASYNEIQLLVSQWIEKHTTILPTLRRISSIMALRKVRIPSLHNQLRILTLRRTILEWYHRTYKQRTVLESYMCAKSEFFLLL